MKVRSNSSEDGFSLIEVLVAFAVLAMTLIALFNGFAVGLRGVGASETRTIALRAAQSKLDEVTATRLLQTGETGGRIDDRYAWQVRVRPYQMTSKAVVTTRLKAYWIEVEVSWSSRNGRNRQSLTLTTIRSRAAQQ